ncbi:type VI secretion system Vgr family protein [Polyangium sorediatum]|uniref:Type VI secretion system tip protein TssI/VgrG n=1 Tax=Polyangium sorediatum TaxID=889274 RepID=A0ABT6P730_9BACT|nr:type VI secretion system tip protein TssI/VgrG [Polyangium sorediatum]MDI1436435.1 type VI secretion system tip protein TssI/VgrG [Polyangium sorediatum]
MAILDLSFESGEQSLSVRHFSVHEGISTLFSANVVARSPKEDIDLESLVGKAGGLLAIGNLNVPRGWTGVVSHAEQIDVEPPTGTSLGLSTYLVRIVPTMWLLTQRKGNRIFQKMSIPDIVKKVLGEYGIEPKMKLTEPHPEHEYRVQYGETDFAFVSRLLEEEGISYWFGQVLKGNNVASELHLADAPTRGEARKPIRHAENPNQPGNNEWICRVHLAHQVRPGAAMIRDYDFEKPKFVLRGEAEKAKKEDFYEQYVYEHGAFTDDKEGKRRADILLEAERRTKRVVSYEANAFDLAPGIIFSIDNHPREDLDPGKKLLVLEAIHEGTPDGEWTLSGEATFIDVPHRPAQRTPRPKINGLQSAFVVGPKGEEIYTDEYGRVRVQFHWDRDGKYDETSTCWIRVSQGWAGAAYGMMTIPRIGQEVLVGFWEGNPDEPVIVGRLYNGKNRVPYKLPDEKTKSTWKTNSSPTTGGFNEIMFEDKAGKELFFVQAQRDLSKLVKRNETERTGANRTMVVGANRSSVVGAVDTTLVGSKYTLVMAKPKDLKVEAMGSPDVEKQETMIEMVDGKITLTTGKATIVLDGATITLKADGDINLKAGGEVVIHGGPFVKINC